MDLIVTLLHCHCCLYHKPYCAWGQLYDSRAAEFSYRCHQKIGRSQACYLYLTTLEFRRWCECRMNYGESSRPPKKNSYCWTGARTLVEIKNLNMPSIMKLLNMTLRWWLAWHPYGIFRGNWLILLQISQRHHKDRHHHNSWYGIEINSDPLELVLEETVHIRRIKLWWYQYSPLCKPPPLLQLECARPYHWEQHMYFLNCECTRVTSKAET